MKKYPALLELVATLIRVTVILVATTVAIKLGIPKFISHSSNIVGLFASWLAITLALSNVTLAISRSQNENEKGKKFYHRGIEYFLSALFMINAAGTSFFIVGVLEKLNLNPDFFNFLFSTLFQIILTSSVIVSLILFSHSTWKLTKELLDELP